METWNAYLSDGTLTDQLLYRGQPIPKDLYHLCVQILVEHTDGSLLLVQSASSKPNFPSYFEASAGGSVLSGEHAEGSAKREVFEETGIHTDHLNHLKTDCFIKDRCIIESFYTTVSVNKDSIQPQPGETEGYIWVPLENLKHFLESKKVLPQSLRLLTKLYD